MSFHEQMTVESGFRRIRARGTRTGVNSERVRDFKARFNWLSSKDSRKKNGRRIRALNQASDDTKCRLE